MPELKRFLTGSIAREEYGDRLRVHFVPGATPELILYDDLDEEISREFVSRDMSYEQLHSYVQSLGFERLMELPDEPEPPPWDDAYNWKAHDDSEDQGDADFDSYHFGEGGADEKDYYSDDSHSEL